MDSEDKEKGENDTRARSVCKKAIKCEKIVLDDNSHKNVSVGILNKITEGKRKEEKKSRREVSYHIISMTRE